MCDKKPLIYGFVITLLALTACSEKTSTGIEPKTMADALHVVLESNRTVYTQKIINRLSVKEKILQASEHWEDDRALVLPAQMFRYSAEIATEKGADFSFSLLSLWPVNKQNKPKTQAEKAGLKYIAENPGSVYYGEEVLGNRNYFTAIYPDTAVATACIECHNNHRKSPRNDFKIGDVMGGVVIRLPLPE